MPALPANSIIQPELTPLSADIPCVEFGESADGFPVARIGDILLALVSSSTGDRFIASAWRLTKPLSDLRREDFYGHDGRVDNEAAFRLRVIETGEHIRELGTLSRVQTRMSASTPWGSSQLAIIHAEGIVCHSTAGHGGFHLSSDRNGKVDPLVRSAGGWYEEDAEWAIVALTFPDLFTGYERRCADETVRNTWPELWERAHRRTLGPGESLSRDRAAFDQAHVEDWVVISAIHSKQHAEMTEVVARKGGARGHEPEERRFLVPQSEYAARAPFGFVVDPVKHALYEGASSFVGWKRMAS